MYIGGGLLGLILIAALILFLVRRTWAISASSLYNFILENDYAALPRLCSRMWTVPDR